ncbi:putative ribonuclease H-like domain-containing protein [Tanacetum coccineum]
MMDQEKEATEQSNAVRKYTPVNNYASWDPRLLVLRWTIKWTIICSFWWIFPIDVANLPHDPLMPEFERILLEIQKADFNNMEPSTIASPIPTTRVHSIHPKYQIIRDPNAKRLIGTSGVIEIKKDERGIVIRNKAGLVAQWYKQEEGINYNEMDVKSDFLYCTINEEVYVCQPLGFVDPEFLEKVYKVEKALYGLHQAPRAWYETLSTYMMDNGFHMGQIDKTLFIKRLKGDIYRVHVYVDDIIFGSTKKSLCDEFEQIMHNRLMIGSLMYLTSFRLDIMFSVCACSRFQVQPKVSHLNAVKRIFRYLKGQPKLGLWYPKDSPLILEAFSDSDYAGASLDRKSTTGAEYIAASHYCGQVLWIQNQMLDYGFNFMQTKIHVDNESAICVVKNPVYHSKTKHIEIRHHFIRDSYEKRLIEMVKIHTDYNVADLLTKAFDVTRFQFLIASIDKKELAIPGQMATGKEFSNPLMADSLPKTILPTIVFGMS